MEWNKRVIDKSAQVCHPLPISWNNINHSTVDFFGSVGNVI